MSHQEKPDQGRTETVSTHRQNACAQRPATTILKVARRPGSMSPRLYMLMVRHKQDSSQA
jgi:hypothetical protein